MLMPVSLRAEREYLYVYRIYKGRTVNKSKCEAGGRPDYLLLITLYGSHKPATIPNRNIILSTISD